MNDTDEQFPVVPAPRGGLAFGCFAGALFGSLNASACCWIITGKTFVADLAIYGAVIGSGLGAIIGWLEGRKPRDGVNIATHVGVLCGLPPGILLFLGGGDVKGELNGLLLTGAILRDRPRGS